MPSDRTKVFISWSGELSKHVATVWRDLVWEMFDGVDPFMSAKDIGAGERGLPLIDSELADTTFGIIVVTQDNQDSQWLNYEAGALSKNVPMWILASRHPWWTSLGGGDATGPISQFQAKLLDRQGIEDILVEIAKNPPEGRRTVQSASGSSGRGTTNTEVGFSEASRRSGKASKGNRPQRDVMNEILTIVRGLSRTTGAGAQLAGPSTQGGERLSLPLDIPLAEIRDVLESFLGANDEVPITLSSTDDGRPVVVIPLQGPVANCMGPLGEALAKLGVAASFEVEPLTTSLRQARLAGTTNRRA